MRTSRILVIGALFGLASQACVAPDNDDDPDGDPNLDDKADGVSATAKGALAWSGSQSVSFTDDAGNSTKLVYLTFALSGNATVTIDTASPSTSSLDTVLYIYAPKGETWGSYLVRDDDSGSGKMSKVSHQLGAGTYRVLVRRKTGTGTPSVHVSGTCTGSGCTPPATGPAITSYFLTPSADGLQPVIDAIMNAHDSIKMEMFHLTQQPVVDALAAVAKSGVDVQLILDNGNYVSHTPAALKTELTSAGVTVIPSSTAFRITHEKSFVVDGKVAFIMSLNLTSPYTTTRDYAVSTTDAGIITEFLSVFAADVANAKNNTNITPTLSSPYLAWSPVNSEDRLVAFVKAAQTTLIVSSENLGDAPIQAALIDAVARGVEVRVMSPLCDQNVNPLYDLPFLKALAQGGVQARAMPNPASASLPYIHAKMMLADDTNAFIGSVNFSTASTTDARELGIFFSDPDALDMISTAFESDWDQAAAPPSTNPTCPTTTN